ncbi:uncharacterized protein N7483_005100 [Penicillium malachiteum]|uniref:uncharacterized protein n=1 Tax=Penicillium malachiteum TaxID=1324776 RepID=UPI002548C5E6|nr:uncharacterized protein N7483_005100 [Penicillium malachiteum]KAJ5730592.1 hypothetical protein N7483_005100 [Penicillium malachiteum]
MTDDLQARPDLQDIGKAQKHQSRTPLAPSDNRLDNPYAIRREFRELVPASRFANSNPSPGLLVGLFPGPSFTLAIVGVGTSDFMVLIRGYRVWGLRTALGGFVVGDYFPSFSLVVDLSFGLGTVGD